MSTPISILTEYYTVKEILDIKIQESAEYWGLQVKREIEAALKYPQVEPFPSRYVTDYILFPTYHINAAYRSARNAFRHASNLIK